MYWCGDMYDGGCVKSFEAEAYCFFHDLLSITPQRIVVSFSFFSFNVIYRFWRGKRERWGASSLLIHSAWRMVHCGISLNVVGILVVVGIK